MPTSRRVPSWSPSTGTGTGERGQAPTSMRPSGSWPGPTGTAVRAIHSALVDEGTDLGSNSVEAIPFPRVALAGGPGVSAYSYGAAWFAFDQRLRLPVTRIDLSDLTGVLDDFSVVVLPSGFGLGNVLGEAETGEIRRWIRGGGTLITLDAATAWLASSGLTGFTEWEAEPAADGTEPPPASVPGAIVRAVVAPRSPLVAGVDGAEIPVMLSDGRLYRPPADAEPGDVVLRYADADRVRLAGYLWPEVPTRVAGSPCLWTESVGAGRIIAFAGDPNFRALWRGLLPLFANAVLLGATF